MQPETDPAIVLSWLLGRKLRADEVYDAFGVKKSTYYDLLSRGTLTSADRLIGVARHFGINPVDLLLRFDCVTMPEVIAAVRRAVDDAEELGKDLNGAKSGKLSFEPRRDRPGWP